MFCILPPIRDSTKGSSALVLGMLGHFSLLTVLNLKSTELEMFVAGVGLPDALFARQQLWIPLHDTPMCKDKSQVLQMLCAPHAYISPGRSRRTILSDFSMAPPALWKLINAPISARRDTDKTFLFTPPIVALREALKSVSVTSSNVSPPIVQSPAVVIFYPATVYKE